MSRLLPFRTCGDWQCTAHNDIHMHLTQVRHASITRFICWDACVVGVYVPAGSSKSCASPQVDFDHSTSTCPSTAVDNFAERPTRPHL